MSLTDIMGAMDLVVWPELALVLFLAVFVSVAVRTFARDRRKMYEDMAKMPLEDSTPRGDVTHGQV